MPKLISVYLLLLAVAAYPATAAAEDLTGAQIYRQMCTAVMALKGKEPKSITPCRSRGRAP